MIREGDPAPHCGMAAVVGRANTGKSTLLNAFLEEKVSVVSPVVQTTRNVIRGVLTDKRGQLVFLDTPGVHRPFHDLGKMMNKMARQAVEGSDAVVLLMDQSARPAEEDEGWMRRLLHAEQTIFLVLNKRDLPRNREGEYRQLWQDLQKEKQVEKDARWVTISAARGEGVKRLLNDLFEAMPPGPYLFPDDVLTDFPKKPALSDIIREPFFEELHDELPHAIAVRIDELDEGEKRWTIRASVLVDRPTQKGIVIGKKGRLLKKVTRQASAVIGEIYGVEVELHLWVKVEPNWAKNFFLLKQLGLAP